jgi:hypothetical protein
MVENSDIQFNVITYWHGKTQTLPIVVYVRKELERVARFCGKSYPEEIFMGADNDYLHTHIGSGMILAQIKEALDLGFSLQKSIDIFGLHDVPEIIKGDEAVLDKERTEIGNEVDVFTAAARLLTQAGVELFREFEEARLFMYAKDRQKAPTPEGVVENVVDLVEGNTTFFEIISGYACSGGTLDVSELVEMGEGYFAQVYEQFREALELLPDSPAHQYAKKLAVRFLDQQVEYIELVKSEIESRNEEQRLLRHHIFGLMGSVAGFVNTMCPKRGEDFEILLNCYFGARTAGRVDCRMDNIVRKHLKVLRQAGVSEENIRKAFRLATLDTQRMGMDKPPEFAGLLEPSVRECFAEKLMERFLED